MLAKTFSLDCSMSCKFLKVSSIYLRELERKQVHCQRIQCQNNFDFPFAVERLRDLQCSASTQSFSVQVDNVGKCYVLRMPVIALRRWNMKNKSDFSRELRVLHLSTCIDNTTISKFTLIVELPLTWRKTAVWNHLFYILRSDVDMTS